MSSSIIQSSRLITVLMASFVYGLNYSRVYRQSMSAAVIADMVSHLNLPLPVGVIVLLSVLIEHMC